MIDAPQPILNQAPESFDCVRMNFASNVDLFAVIDSQVGISPSAYSVVGAKLISEHNGIGKDVAP